MPFTITSVWSRSAPCGAPVLCAEKLEDKPHRERPQVRVARVDLCRVRVWRLAEADSELALGAAQARLAQRGEEAADAQRHRHAGVLQAAPVVAVAVDLVGEKAC